MELEGVVKGHSGTIKDSTLCGMGLNDFYEALISVVFPGFTKCYVKDEKYDNELNYSPDDIASMFYSARVSGVRRVYYIENPLGIKIEIPEFFKDDQRYLDETRGIEGVTFRPYSKHPLYIKAENLARIIRAIDAFSRFGVCGMYRPHAVMDALEPYLKYEYEPFSALAVAVIKWLTAHIGVEHRNVFVDYLANEECYHELYVELVEFIHEYLTEQDNTAKFEL